jgi:acyl-CoA thioesterase
MKKSLEVIEPGRVKVRLSYFKDLDQAMGMLHGGVYAALLDTASYYAAVSAYQTSGKLPLTQEYKINLLTSVSGEDLVADSRVVKSGKRVAVVETKIHSDSGKLAAVGLTSLIIRS